DFSSSGMSGVPTATHQVLGSGDGNVDSFALVKMYGSGEQRGITRPVPGGVGLAVAGPELTTGRTLQDQGLIEFDQPPAADAGITPAAVSRSLGLEPHSGEVAGAVSSDALNPVDLAVGRWDAARVCLTAVDWRDENAAAIPLICGEIGSVSINGDGFSADLRGAAAKLDDPV